jgi:thymidylate synthase
MTDLQPGEFIHMLGDTHIYQNHVDPLLQQLEREPRPFPILDINFDENKPIEDYTLEDFKLIGYNPHKTIKMDMAV